MQFRAGTFRWTAALPLLLWIFVSQSSPLLAATAKAVAKVAKPPAATPSIPAPIQLPEATIGDNALYDQRISVQMSAGMDTDLTFSFGNVGVAPLWLQIPDANRAEMKGDLTSATAKASCSGVCHYLFHVIVTDDKFHQVDQAYELTVTSAMPAPATASATAGSPAEISPATASTTAAPVAPVDQAAGKTGQTNLTPVARTAPVVPGNAGGNSAPEIVGPLIEGSSTVTVATTDKDALSLWSFPSTTQSTCDDSGSIVPLTSGGGTVDTVTATSDVVTLTLKQPLAAGTSLCVSQIAQSATSSVNSSVKAVQDPLNYGRVHMYFVGGVLVSNTQSSFSSSTASQFLAFDIDKTWRLSGCNGLYPRVANDHPMCSQPVFSPGISTYFDTQLTAIPVAPQSTTQFTSTTGSSTTTTATASNAITSQKVARVAVGLYAPFVVQHWGQTTPNAFYIAPIAKVGFNTLTGNTTQTNLTSGAPNMTVTQASQPTTGTLQTFSRVYNFYTFGGRLGWETLNNSRDRAPDPVALFDFDFGPYSSLESFICHPTGASGSPNYPGSSCGKGALAGLPNASRKRIYRFDIQGLITVPHTPIALGFNANIGQRTIGSEDLDPALAPGDDVRFLFGTKFDISTALQKLNLPSY